MFNFLFIFGQDCMQLVYWTFTYSKYEVFIQHIYPALLQYQWNDPTESASNLIKLHLVIRN